MLSVQTEEGEQDVKLKCGQAAEVVAALRNAVDNLLRRRQSLVEASATDDAARASHATMSGVFGAAAAGTSAGAGGTTVIRGWLAKQRGKIPQVMQRRFFVLSERGAARTLRYYTGDDNGARELGSVDLAAFRLLEDASSHEHRRIVFTAFQSNKQRTRTFVLVAETQGDFTAWMHALSPDMPA